MWTIHQPPPRVTSISKLDSGPSLDEAVGLFTHEHEIGQAPVQRSSGHAIVVTGGRRQPVPRKPGSRLDFVADRQAQLRCQTSGEVGLMLRGH